MPHLISPNVRSLACLAVVTLTSTGCMKGPDLRAVAAASQYVSVQPTGSAPILTGYHFDLLEHVEGAACAERNTRYTVALTGVQGSPTLGELAAGQAALAKLKDADMLLVIRSSASTQNGKECGVLYGRGVRLRTIDLKDSPKASESAHVEAPR